MKKSVLILLLFISVHSSAFVFRLTDLPIFSTQVDVVTRPLIAGLWGMRLANIACIEYYNFQEDGNLSVNSAEERSVGRFEYTLRPQNDTALPFLQMQITDENLKADCSHQAIDQRGEVSQYFVNWVTANQIQFCLDDKGLECFSTLNRVLP